MDIFKPGEQDSVSQRYGAEFLLKVQRDIDTYSSKWWLCDLRFVPYYSVNCIFTGTSPRYGGIVLKIGKPNRESYTERATLLEYQGRRFIRLLEDDIDNGVMLIERVLPGTRLRDEAFLDKRLDIFCGLYRELHIQAADPAQYPTYQDWVRRITSYMSTRPDCTELYGHMKMAQDISEEMSARYRKQLLLHGDLHHDNILLAHDGQYRLIDPKGVIGDPVFDIGRFILNEPYEETDDPEDAVHQIVLGLSRRLELPALVIMQGFYIEITMGECWSVQDGLPMEEYPRRLGNVAFVKRLLDKMTAYENRDG